MNNVTAHFWQVLKYIICNVHYLKRWWTLVIAYLVSKLSGNFTLHNWEKGVVVWYDIGHHSMNITSFPGVPVSRRNVRNGMLQITVIGQREGGPFSSIFQLRETRDGWASGGGISPWLYLICLGHWFVKCFVKSQILFSFLLLSSLLLLLSCSYSSRSGDC